MSTRSGSSPTPPSKPPRPRTPTNTPAQGIGLTPAYNNRGSPYNNRGYSSPTRASSPARKIHSAEEELRFKLWAAFDDLDEDGSGTLSVEELVAMCKSLKMDIEPRKLARLITSTDTDGSGDIGFEEFVTAMQRHMAEGEDGALGSIFAAKTGAMFDDFLNILSTPFKGAFDNILATPFSKGLGNLFTGDAKQRQQQEEVDDSAQHVYGAWDLSGRRPRKAATPKRADSAHYSPPKSMRSNVPSARFRDVREVKDFFSAPRVASAGAHSVAHTSSVSTASFGAGGGRPAFGSSASARPSTFLGNNAAIALQRAGARSAGMLAGGTAMTPVRSPVASAS